MWIGMGVVGLATSGCDVFVGGRHREEPVYVTQQPQYVEQQPQYVVVQEAPPPVIVERRPAPPAAGYIWIDGSWDWNNQRYVWQAGRYERPPQPDVVWIAPRYERDASGYRYSRGQWGKQNHGHDHDRH